jgi:hypothetical protein
VKKKARIKVKTMVIQKAKKKGKKNLHYLMDLIIKSLLLNRE